MMFITCGVCSGQNLIPNGDFELGPDSSSAGWHSWVDSTFCNLTISVNGPDYWIKESGSPDRMVEGTIFTCNWDNDTAESGNAYIVIGSGNNNYREGGKATLLSALEQDTLYHLKYCASLQTFNGFNTQPELVAFIFNNGGDSIVSPLITSVQWQCYDTVFSSTANSSEIIIRAVYPVGLGPAANVDNVKLEKISSTGISTLFRDDKSVFFISKSFYR